MKQKKITVCLNLIEDDYKKFKEKCGKALTCPSREISLYIREQLKEAECTNP